MPPRRGPLPRSPRPSRPGSRGDGSGRPRCRGPGSRRPRARRPGAGHGLFVVPPAVVVAPNVRREALSRGHVGCVDGRAVAAYARVSRWERVRQRRGLRFGCGKHDVSLATPRPAARSPSTTVTVHRRRCGWNSCTAPVIFADNARGAPPCSGEAPLCGGGCSSVAQGADDARDEHEQARDDAQGQSPPCSGTELNTRPGLILDLVELVAQVKEIVDGDASG